MIKSQYTKQIIIFHSFLLVTILLLTTADICYYFIKHWLKRKDIHYYINIKRWSNIELKEIDIKNCTCQYFDNKININFALDILLDKKSHGNILLMMFLKKIHTVQSLYKLFWVKQINILGKMMKLNIQHFLILKNLKEYAIELDILLC